MAALWLAIGVCSASAAAVVKTLKVCPGAWGVSSDRSHVWVTCGGNKVVEIDASTGKVVRTIKPRAPQGAAGAVSSDGTHVWVANFYGFVGTVTEIQIRKR